MATKQQKKKTWPKILGFTALLILVIDTIVSLIIDWDNALMYVINAVGLVVVVIVFYLWLFKKKLTWRGAFLCWYLIAIISQIIIIFVSSVFIKNDKTGSVQVNGVVSIVLITFFYLVTIKILNKLLGNK